MHNYEQTPADFQQIERARDLPPDQDEDPERDSDPYDHQEDDDDVT